MKHNTFPLFQILLHKIHIKEWESKKDHLLSLIPFNDEKYRTAEINYTDYFDKNEKSYENEFLSLIRPYLDEFLKTSDYKFTRVDEIWCQRYKSNDYHPPHDHGAFGYSCVFYAKLDEDEHPSTISLSPFQSIEGNHDVESIVVAEGDLVIFPCNLMHMAPSHRSDKDRIIISFNLL